MKLLMKLRLDDTDGEIYLVWNCPSATLSKTYPTWLGLSPGRDLLVATWAMAWYAIPTYCFALYALTSRLQQACE